ncbi:MAG: metallophosphoesterase [Flavobacteriaceae bacterium]
MKNTKSLNAVALMFLLLSVSNSELLAQTTLVSFGSSWSYYDNQNEPSNQGPLNWTDITYSDATWPTGNAELGYGDGDEVTNINSATLTAYFRHEFNIADPNDFSDLNLNLIYDDGAVVYLNGNEVWRVDMPMGTISYTTFSSAVIGNNATKSTSITNGLITGTNVISVEVHQANAGSSDISFDFELTANGNAPPTGGDLIEAGSTWKYLDDGSNQGTAWRGTGFNDSSWASGNAQLGFGEGDEATVISDVNQITNYFRKTITVSAAQAASANLLLEAIRDDGMVVYINGTEVWRDYMPTGTINYNTTATTHVPDDGNDWQTNTITNSLIVGTNVIAVEIHQNSSTSSDVSFDFKMTDSGGSPPISDEFITDSDSWKYLDNGSNQGTAWTGIGFDDSSWASGAAELGYGDGGEATTVSFGSNSNNKHVTTYFRKTFNVTDPSAYDYLSLEAIRDDGMVVYLNGVEVWNDGLPTSFDYLTYANQTIGGSNESTWISKAIANTLVTGTNVVAVEIHQTNATSSDISFNFRLSGSKSGGGTANLERGPYLQKGTTTSVVVRWRTDVPTESVVNYGTSLGSLNQNESDLLPKTEHEIEITGLNADTKYYYNIANSAGVIISESTDLYFETHPTVGSSQPYKFWILGDAGTANSNQRAVRDAYYNYIGSNHTDGILFLGDNAYNSGTDSEYQNAMFENMYEDKLKNSISWSTLGNHDGYSADSNSQTGPYYDIFTFPTLGESGGMASGTEAYYSFDYGNIHFIVLDSYETDRSVGGTMYNWAQSDIQNTTQEWIVAFWHHPPYTKGSHDSDTESELIDMRENFLPMLEGNGVDLVLNGHSHSYERSYLLNGHYGSSNTFNSGNHTVGATGAGDGKADGNGAYVKETSGPEAGDGAVYITTGSAGKISGGSLNHNAMYASLNELGSCILEVDGNTLHVKFIRETGAIDDYFTIEKGCSSDADGDGVCDADDQCPGFDDTVDVDNDSIPDGCDPLIDSDGDGVADSEDQCPGFDDTIDVDNDNIPDGCDPLIDSDGDGVSDSQDQCPGFDDNIDVNGNGIPDGCDLLVGCSGGISTFPYVESFENTLGGWTQSVEDDIDWTVDSNGTPSRNTGPTNAADGTYYLYVEASSPNYPSVRSILNSPCFDLTALTEATFSFSYHMFGAADMGTIDLEISDDDGATWTSIWSQFGNQGNSWLNVDVNLNAYTGAGIQLRFNRFIGSTWQADIAIDNIRLIDEEIIVQSCSAEISSFPYIEGFESALGGWTQSAADDMDWIIDANGTPSRNTGPSSAIEGTNYLYVEASTPNYPSKRAIINSPCFDLSLQSSATFSFNYHQYGSTDMGTLNLEASADNGNSWSSIWNSSGNLGNSWQLAIVDLSAYLGNTVQLRFNRFVGGTWQADIAIDNINLTTSVGARTPNDKLLDIDDNMISSFLIYPIPASRTLFVDCKMYNGTKATISLYNIRGSLVKTVNLDGDYSEPQKIDLDKFSDGLYLLVMKDLNGNVLENERILVRNE